MNIKSIVSLALVAVAMAVTSVAPAEAWHHRYYGPVVTNYGYVPGPHFFHHRYWR